MPVAPGTYNYILSPHEWRKLNPDKPSSVMGWTHPVGAATALDLRPLGAMGVPETAEGYGFFALQQGADIPAGALLLGSDIDGVLSTQARRDAEAMLDLAAGDLDWGSVLNTLWGLFTEIADPTGSNAVKPLMPTVQGNLDLHLSGHSLVRREGFDRVRHPKALQQIRSNYQRMLQSVHPQMRGEMLQRLMRKTGLSARDITVPSGAATIADDFTETSDTSLHLHTPTGTNAFTGSWNENVGDWLVVASDDRAESAGNADPNIARADPSSGGLTSDDHYSQSTVAAIADFWAVGAAARMEAASDDCYIYRRDVSNTDSQALKKYVSGVFSTVGTAIQGDFPDPATPWDAYLECDGSTITIKEAGVTKITETDTSLSGQTHAGLYVEGAHSNSGAEYGSWEASDLGGAPPPAPVRRRLMMMGVGR